MWLFCHFCDLGIWNDTNTLQCERTCSLLLTQKHLKCDQHMALQSSDVVVFVLWKDLCTSHSQKGRGCLVVQPLMNARQHTGGVLFWYVVAANTGSEVTSQGLLNLGWRVWRVWTEHRWSSCQFHSPSITNKWTLRHLPAFHHWESHVEGHPAVRSVVWISSRPLFFPLPHNWLTVSHPVSARNAGRVFERAWLMFMLCTATYVRCFAVPVRNHISGESWFAKCTNSTRTSVSLEWTTILWNPCVVSVVACRIIRVSASSWVDLRQLTSELVGRQLGIPNANCISKGFKP